MRKLGFARLLAALTAVGVVAFASPAWANTIININDGNVPTTAWGFADHECSDNLGGGPFADKDVWVFNLPSQGGAAGAFVSVTATFNTNTPAGYLTKTIPTDGGAIVPQGTSKAWIVLDAGWTLTAASAEITGDDEELFFVLTHTCPATSTSPSPSTSASSSTSPSPSTSASSSASASASASSSAGTPSPDPSSPGSPGTSVSGSQPPLPRTGAAVTGMLVTGGVAIAIGAALLLLMRRRRANLTTLDD